MSSIGPAWPRFWRWWSSPYSLSGLGLLPVGVSRISSNRHYLNRWFCAYPMIRSALAMFSA